MRRALVIAGVLATSCTLLTDLGGLASSQQGAADAASQEGAALSDGPAVEASSDGSARFFDDFGRPDGPLGNGWIAKTPVFSIERGVVIRSTASLNYHDAIAYRPSNEDLRDVEASVEFEVAGTTPGSPQLIVRGEAASIALAGQYVGYMLFIPGDAARGRVSRQRGSGVHTPLSDFDVSPPTTAGEHYRLRARVSGASPVKLTGFIERRVGTAWEIIGQTSVDDASPLAITGPGTVGFGANGDDQFTYDNFSRTAL